MDQHGTKLFSQAFNPGGGPLGWISGDEGERAGKMNLFAATFQSHRNRRAHRESSEDGADLLAEFLLLNHLYRLEKHSVKMEVDNPSASRK
jgi:hypothetical protein